MNATSVAAPLSPRLEHESSPPSAVAAPVPRWDCDRQELRLGDQLVKRFTVPRPAQEMILAVFEESAWPESIDSPLAGDPRFANGTLEQAVAALNRHQRQSTIHFTLRDGRIAWRAL